MSLPPRTYLQPLCRARPGSAGNRGSLEEAFPGGGGQCHTLHTPLAWSRHHWPWPSPHPSSQHLPSPDLTIAPTPTSPGTETQGREEELPAHGGPLALDTAGRGREEESWAPARPD